MTRKTLALYFLLCVAPAATHAKLFLLLDERLKNSHVEQTIYKFVPLTSASEVELNYVQGFLQNQSAAVFAAKLNDEDRAIYIGSDRWPRASYIRELTEAQTWAKTAAKIFFLVENDGPDFARMPKGFFPRREIWRKYAEITKTKYVGYFSTHYLDARSIELNDSAWPSFTCIHETGRELPRGKDAPLRIAKNKVQLAFRLNRQLDYLGALVCINTPKADAIFEMHTEKTDVALRAESGKFSFWNEAQPLHLHVASNHLITAPLDLQIIPEANETQTEFFFQGERITCTGTYCRKRSARFLLPEFRTTREDITLAVRAAADGYFRGTLRVMAGEIEIARSRFRFTPHSWLSETSYALGHFSEYQIAFFLLLLSILAATALAIALWFYLRRALRHRAERDTLRRRPRVTSACAQIESGVEYTITATENPFDCELYAFGGIVSLCVEGESVRVKHNASEVAMALDSFRYPLPDRYCLALRRDLQGKLLLDVYLLEVARRAK